MNLSHSRLTIMLVLTATTGTTLLLNIMVRAEQWIIIVLGITVIVEIIWFVGYFNGRGRK